jgi:hypothetical protein
VLAVVGVLVAVVGRGLTVELTARLAEIVTRYNAVIFMIQLTAVAKSITRGDSTDRY